MFENLQKYRVVLSSNSPRRRELLSGLGIDYVVSVPNEADESFPENLPGGKIPIYIAQSKAQAFAPYMQDNDLVITADTIVYIDGKVLGKPSDEQQAKEMLRLLSGRKHEVITGVCITTKEKQKSFFAVSEVTFACLTDPEIDYYVSRYRPYDKAGSYGAQEWIGYVAILNIEGSYFNVMGLPIQRLYTELKDF